MSDKPDRGTPWSEADDAQIERFILMGGTAPEIAELFPGRTMRAIEERCKLWRKVHDMQRGQPRRKSVGPVSLPPDVSYDVARRIEAERGCRLLKQAMDRYYANRPRQEAA